MVPEALTWWLLSLVLSAAGYPILSLIRKEDVYGLSRAASLLILTYLTWITGHVTGIHAWTAAALLVILATASAAIVTRTGKLPSREEVLKTEALFASIFLFFLATRIYSPEILHTGGEKFMDYAFTRSVASGAPLPPEDPWMAGKQMFYYYVGYVAAADMKLLTGVPWDKSFNLIVPVFAGTAATAAYSLGRLLKTQTLPIVAVFSGNLASVALAATTVAPRNLAERLAPIIGGEAPFTYSYFQASRVIPNTVNEFPFFTFLHADPHAHMYSIPFQLTHIALLTLYLDTEGTRRKEAGLLALTALNLGFFYPLNTWEFPTYALLTAGALVLKRGALKGGLATAAVTASSVALYLPYHLSIQTSRGLALVHHRTTLTAFLGVNGILLALILLYLHDRLKKKEFLATTGAMALLAAAGTPIDFQLLALLPLIPATLVLLNRTRPDRNTSGNRETLPALALLLGTCIAIGVEVVRIEGVYAGELERLNTVFKFYLQLWILWSIPAAKALTDNLPNLEALAQPLRAKNGLSTGKRLTQPVHVLTIILVAALLTYPATGTWDRTGHFEGEPELSGTAYVEDWRPGEHEAIQFLDRQPRGVVMEAWGKAYHWNTVAGSLTKHSSVIGWANHELGWRENDETVRERKEDVEQFYNRKDLDLLQKYEVDYVYVGPIERQRYPWIWENFDDDLEKIFDNGVVKIYRAPNSTAPPD